MLLFVCQFTEKTFMYCLGVVAVEKRQNYRHQSYKTPHLTIRVLSSMYHYLTIYTSVFWARPPQSWTEAGIYLTRSVYNIAETIRQEQSCALLFFDLGHHIHGYNTGLLTDWLVCFFHLSERCLVELVLCSRTVTTVFFVGVVDVGQLYATRRVALRDTTQETYTWGVAHGLFFRRSSISRDQFLTMKGYAVRDTCIHQQVTRRRF